MKNIKQFTQFLIVFCSFFLPFVAFTQPAATGYKIVFKSQNVSDKYLYLTGFFGDKTYTIDSAKFAGKQYVFKNSKKELPSGFYQIRLHGGVVLADFFVEHSRKFTINATNENVEFINSNENIVYRKFKKDYEAGNYLWHYYETTPETLLAKFIRAQYVPVSVPEFHWGSHAGQEAAAQKYYQFLIDHYFDNIDFKDIRLLYTPLNVDLQEFFMESLYPQTSENMITSIENLFKRITDEKPTPAQLAVRDYYLKKLIHLYMTADPKFDDVFVYLVDHYVSKLTASEFIADSEAGVFKRIADRKRRTLVGETIPVFESFMNNHHKISTADIPTKYTLLWFWDPDCEHCIEYTPVLCEFYSKYRSLYDFEVIACSVTEDYDRWIAFINNHHLEWFNTSYAIEEPNYDAVEFFNFSDTPAIFIIDKQHQIVARQFHIDELFEVFESLHNE